MDILRQQPLLLLFGVAAAGTLIGRARIFGLRLGVAGVLFAGIAVGALDPRFQLPELVNGLGLVLFLYPLGLASGPGFVRALGRDGPKAALLALVAISTAAGADVLLASLLGLGPERRAGAFAGALTNTPALAAAVETLGRATQGGASPERLAEPVVAYSLSYPFGVLGLLLAIHGATLVWKKRRSGDANPLDAREPAPIEAWTLVVKEGEATHATISELKARHGWPVVFDRLLRAGHELTLVEDTVRLAPGDQVSVVGKLRDLGPVVGVIGERAPEGLELDRSVIDFRRMFVSNPDVAGRTLGELDVRTRLGVLVTRVRRADEDLTATANTALELGDRVRVVGSRAHMESARKFFGDSLRAITEVDPLALGVGLMLGIVIGLVPIPIPGRLPVRLGMAGGPLVVSLLLGYLGRTGPVLWTMPYPANMTLRQLGLILFMSGVGLRAGYPFFHTLRNGGALPLLAAGGLITMTSAVVTLVVGRWIRVPRAALLGMLAGIHTQPAALPFALERTGDDQPSEGYAAVFPAATLAKIVLAQLLVGG